MIALIFMLALSGAALLTGGIFIIAGMGWALMAAGLACLAFAVLLSRGVK